MRKLLAAFVVLGVVACSDGPTEPEGSSITVAPLFSAAQTSTDNQFFPINMTEFVPCAAGGAGEEVELSGNLHLLTHMTVNDNNVTVKVHGQPQGVTGVGLTTGDTYRATGVSQFTENGSFVNGQFTFMGINNFRLIGPGPGNNLLVHQTLHITVNANGDVTVNSFKESIECK